MILAACYQVAVCLRMCKDAVVHHRLAMEARGMQMPQQVLHLAACCAVAWVLQVKRLDCALACVVVALGLRCWHPAAALSVAGSAEQQRSRHGISHAPTRWVGEHGRVQQCCAYSG